jgi:Family of unknown function (DUF5320)
MPGFNGTGPLSAGPMTGHGQGYCMSHISPDPGFKQVSCSGGGRGWRHWYHVTGLPRWARCASSTVPAAPVYAPPLYGGQELSFLKGQVEYLENALEHTKNRIKELENKD